MKAVFLRQLEDDVFLFCEEHSGADTAAPNARFGSPDTVAEEFLGALDPIVFSREYRNKQKIAALAVFAVLTVALIAGCFTIREYKQAQREASENAIDLVPYEGTLPEVSGPGYWVRTNNGKDITYWEFDYEANEWVNVPIPNE